jgi:hypothetical protein
MESLIKTIFAHESLVAKPPVLLDIGASGSLPAQWGTIAPYSICVAFDADERDFKVEETEGKGCKKLYSLNRIVAPHSSEGLDFYLTKSPYCSSALEPDIAALEVWSFQHLFQVERTIKLPAVDLNTALKQIGLDRIDWYKTDSQGTDLRIFKSLPDEFTNKVIVADFEPGILDAYKGEDKLHQIMAHMETKPFWVAHMLVKGPHRVHQSDMNKMDYFEQRGMRKLLKTSPGWCEIDYFNTFEAENLTIREFLLGWVFATIKQQHGFAMRIASIGAQRFKLALFNEMQDFSKSKITFSSLELAYVKLRRLAAKLLGRP